jgi:cell division protein FtsB
MARRSSKKKSSPRRRPGKHLRARTTGIRIVNRFAFLILVAMTCVAVAALSVPQVRKLRELKEELTRTENQEHHVVAFKDQKNRELRALQSDPAYLELIARDRLDLQQTGEQIYRINR